MNYDEFYSETEHIVGHKWKYDEINVIILSKKLPFKIRDAIKKYALEEDSAKDFYVYRNVIYGKGDDRILAEYTNNIWYIWLPIFYRAYPEIIYMERSFREVR